MKASPSIDSEYIVSSSPPAGSNTGNTAMRVDGYTAHSPDNADASLGQFAEKAFFALSQPLTLHRVTPHNRWMSRFSLWLPELARKTPGKDLTLSYQVPAGVSPVDAENRIVEALRRSELAATRDNPSTWRTIIPWRTRVFGLIPRDVDEDVTFHLEQHPDHWELRVNCHPLETHGAHAAGFAGVLFLAVSVWIASGILTGMVAALASILAGTLIVEVTRQWAFDALESRLRIFAQDMGSALWPGLPAQIVELNG